MSKDLRVDLVLDINDEKLMNEVIIPLQNENKLNSLIEKLLVDYFTNLPKEESINTLISANNNIHIFKTDDILNCIQSTSKLLTDLIDMYLSSKECD